MSYWLRAFCTRSVEGVTLEQVRHALDSSDFAMMAEWQELDEEVGYAAEASLRFEEVERSDSLWTVLVHYRDHEKGETFVRFDLWTDPTEVREEIDELLQSSEGSMPTRAAEVLGKAVETAAFDLKLFHTRGMGWPIAFHLAMWLAGPERGDGVVEYEDVWWDPRTYEVLGRGGAG